MNPDPAPKYCCLVVDDEPVPHRILQTYLEGHARFEIAAYVYHTADARRYCQSEPVDVLLLDIQMPEETGLDFLRSLDKRPVTILTTAHLEFALEGYELGVMEYLVKPIQLERFDLALHWAVEFLDLL
jgi:response regulator of citrate/malate metabolism